MIQPLPPFSASSLAAQLLVAYADVGLQGSKATFTVDGKNLRRWPFGEIGYPSSCIVSTGRRWYIFPLFIPSIHIFLLLPLRLLPFFPLRPRPVARASVVFTLNASVL